VAAVKVRQEGEVLLVFTLVAVLPDGAILAEKSIVRIVRRICKSSVHGVVEKVGSDSWEKKLPSRTAERHIVSASSTRRWCELDGPGIKGV
jgi:hypothetical protein